ncbi:hypothetical protein CSV72_13560 [Sporosarcina sp. P20a]|uniref:S-layer homology domain-containing protein n=1 Tax=Sporosarcina sp. P20a TaxID=2048256 RepID=UPI000C16CD59|nr:S-layer homology domain-containing protein [Sporosarcina sp. P20a]PIC85438.1 hypothetical protein CSV72_13560 [Sporosarcina sp. P20a]
MANQPTKYRKFVVGAASAALVASAVAPVAFAAEFTDVKDNNSHKAAIGALSDAGVISGYPDGTFQPNKTLTRSDVAKLMGKWLIAQGYKVPTDYKTNPRFTDLTSKSNDELLQMAALVKDNGVFNGNDGKLLPADNITRENMAVVLVRALNTLNDFDLVAYVKEQDWKKDVTDLNKAKAEARPAIDVLDFFDITNPAAPAFNPKNTTTRGQFASFLYKAAETNYDEVKAKETAIESVKATNAKTITITFNQAVETEKAKVELLRGTFKQNVTLKWSDDKKSVELIGAGNYQAADYTVNVTGLSDKALTGTVKVEAVKIASIEILDEVAVVNKDLVNGVFPTDTTATVGYMVKDQYGTDITKNTNLTTNDNSNIGAKDGVVTIGEKVVAGKKLNDLVPVVLIDTKSGLSTTKTLKLSATPTVSDISVTGIFNAKGEEVALNDKTNASDAFIVVDLKDQYGKVITDVDKAKGLVVTNTNEENLLLKKNSDEKTEIVTQTIGNATKLVIKIEKIKKAGETDLILISTTNGKSANYTVKVAETETTDAITVGQPEVAVKNEETLIPVTVTDKNGNVITDLNLLSNKDKGIKIGGKNVEKANLVVKDGQVFYKETFTTEGTQALVFQTATYKVATLTVNVKAEAKPVAVRGLKKPLVLKAGGKETIDFGKVNVEDQYGRTMEKLTDGYTIAVKGITADDKKVVTVVGNEITAGPKNGTATITIFLTTKDDKDAVKEVANSAVEQQVRVTDGKEYKSYEVKDLGLLHAEKAADEVAGTLKGENKITVSGVLADGGKVELDGTADYVATTNVTGVSVENGKLIVDQKNIKQIFTVDNKEVAEREVKVTFTINNDGSKVEHTYKISNTPAKVQDFFFTATQADKSYSAAKAITEATVITGGTIANLVSGETKDKVHVATSNQYGTKKVEDIKASTVTIVPEKVTDVKITSNGTTGAKVSLANDVKEATVTFKVTIDGVTKDIKVKVTPQ